MSSFLFKNGQKVVFIGDSITECGRNDRAVPYGDGYVRLSMDLIRARYPERKIEFVNKGTSGHTVLDLNGRWYDDVIRQRPDWLAVAIGCNDMNKTVCKWDGAVSVDQFEEIYRKLLRLTRKETHARLILMDPFYMSQDHSKDSWRGGIMRALPPYIRVVQKLAREFKTLHVRSHEAFQRQLKYRDTDVFCSEPIHPGLSGNIVLAHEFLKVVGW